MESREWRARSERAAQRDEEKKAESSRDFFLKGKEGKNGREGQTGSKEGAHLASILTL